MERTESVKELVIGVVVLLIVAGLAYVCGALLGASVATEDILERFQLSHRPVRLRLVTPNESSPPDGKV